MEINKGIVCSTSTADIKIGEETELRRGPWTIEEDITLINYIENHGEGRWNSLARSSGLNRTGKSCRLRWLNYLRPDVRRGNITLEEQLLILELHSRFGNRWSKIAQHLPGRTDNEIKNYWRTRVQKHAKQLKCDVNSKQFKDVMYHLWIPRLLERIQTNSTVPEPVNGQHEQSPGCSSSDSVVTRSSSPLTSDCFPVEGFNVVGGASTGGDQIHEAEYRSLAGYSDRGLLDFEEWDMGGNLWNVEDIWF